MIRLNLFISITYVIQFNMVNFGIRKDENMEEALKSGTSRFISLI
jgi:hypothetical protein